FYLTVCNPANPKTPYQKSQAPNIVGAWLLINKNTALAVTSGGCLKVRHSPFQLLFIHVYD
ncbi:hypothetical protein ACTXNA_05965, partial [Psychrobacter celer]|uniref:hypothetical protein n=1 Tax=Psychrobacter celer TaxID=306572 RepID=UPI003FD1EC78